MGLETEQDLHLLLEQEGDINHFLERTLPSEPDFSSSYALPGSEECRLCEIPYDSNEDVYARGDNYYIACTSGGPGDQQKGWSDGRKGHDVRNMAVWQNHGVLPSLKDIEHSGYNMLELLRDKTAEQIQDGEMVVGGSMQTFEDHTHFIAEDVQNEGVSDLPGLNNYALYRVENGIPEFQTHQSREKIGDYMEQALKL